MTVAITNASAVAAANAVVDRIDLGTTNAQGRLRIYAGAIPANADAALSGNTLLAELQMSNPAFGNAADGNPDAIATASAITQAAAVATGTASFFRIINRDEVVILQGSISAVGGGGDLIFNSVAIQSSAVVQVTQLTYRQPEM